ncbi:unnamed protein product [Staurois parvus]|uniref:Uncharacterized protein n=1 Tax=Staurois parvus TaxID=386267 RepID=A0ABN9A944_9NEOB|nr:unnamed protein product [Staurois parvus]
MDQYAEASGSKVNQDKCELLWMGREGESFSLPEAFPVPQPNIKVLGINFCPADYSKQNWESKLSDVEVKVRCWKGWWRLSLRERVDLIKTFLLPVFLYVSFVCLLPESLYTRIYSCFFPDVMGESAEPRQEGRDLLIQAGGWPRYGQPGGLFSL